MVAFLGLILSVLAGFGWARKVLKDKPGYENWLPWVNASRLSVLAYLTTSIFLHDAYIRYFWILIALGINAIRLTQMQVLEEPPIRSGTGLLN